MTERQAQSLAEMLVIGDGTPRSRGDAIKEVTKTLMRVYSEGHGAGRIAQREMSIAEAKLAIDGALQALNAARHRMDLP